ncbi:recombinase family protein [Streptomyces albidoflavus]
MSFWTPATLLRRLRNPALLGHRVEEDKTREGRRSRSVLDASGEPIRVAPAIFTDEEFAGLQEALDRKAKRQPPRRRGGTTQFAGVLVRADCSGNMTVQTTRNKKRVYTYLRCARCRNGRMRAPDSSRYTGGWRGGRPEGARGAARTDAEVRSGDRCGPGIPVQVGSDRPGKQPQSALGGGRPGGDGRRPAACGRHLRGAADAGSRHTGTLRGSGTRSPRRRTRATGRAEESPSAP